MEEMINHPAIKFIVEKTLAPLLAVIITLTIRELIGRNKRIKNSATMEDLKKVEDCCKSYTDDELRRHLTYSHVPVANELKEIKESHRETDKKIDRILFMMAENNKQN